jgi:protein phosphatase
MPKSPYAIDQRHLRGPFDIIGDVHACADELVDLLDQLGYQQDDGTYRSTVGRTAVFVGDFVDRGPENTRTLTIAMDMVADSAAFAVPGNHDLQLERHLSDGDVPLVYGLAETVAELDLAPPAFRDRVRRFLQDLPGHLVFDDGRLVVAHTGLPTARHLRFDGETRVLAAYGVTAGEMDPHDPEKRHPWVATHQGPAVVYGHTPVLEPVWRNDSIDIDTGCAFGWRLSALQWPERTLASVPARRVYARRSRPFLPSDLVLARPARAGSDAKMQ